MPSPAELQAKFWKSLRSDMTVMLGLADAADGHTRPMTAQLDGDGEHGPIWFFSARDASLVQALQPDSRVIASFVSKGNDLFACVHGTLHVDNNPAVIDRLWNRFVAAWYEGGKADPRLVLLRLDPEKAEIWENASGLVAGLKLLLGVDPKEDYKDKVAKVRLG